MKKIKYAIYITAILTLSSCGSGGVSFKDNHNNKSALFLDSAVEGLGYIVDNDSERYTDKNGKFIYSESSKNITFKIGNLAIKENYLLSKIKNGILLPTDLLDVKRSNTSTDVVKILQVLQSLDEDNNPDNGIKITKAIRDKFILKTNIKDNSASAIISVASKTLVTEANAILHFQETLKKIRNLPLLVIRIEFNDYSFHSNTSIWSNKIFGTNKGQLNDYFKETSNGHFQLTKAIETKDTVNDGIITIKLDINHPNTGKSDIDNLILPALSKVDTYIDFSSYDDNKDGYISLEELQIMFLVAGKESAIHGTEEGVWAHASCLNLPSIIKDGMHLLSCGKGGYSAFGERHNNYKNVTEYDATIGIIAHELGHAALWLPDLYDTTKTSNGIGFFGLMGSGSWAKTNSDIHSGQTPTHLTGWSKIQSGFIKPTIISTSKTGISILGSSYTDTGTKSKVYKIPTNDEKEYFLVENRIGGYDEGLDKLEGVVYDFSGGMLITHINDNQIGNGNDNKNYKLVDIEEANDRGLDSVSPYGHNGHLNNLFFHGNETEFTPNTTTNSNTYNNSSSDISITNISAPGKNMTMDITIN